MSTVETIGFVVFMLFTLAVGLGLPWFGHKQDIREQSDTDEGS